MPGSTVLVVDDEPRILEFLEENLRADDYVVLTASDGAEAMSMLETASPDVVLLDVVARYGEATGSTRPGIPTSRSSC